MRLAQVFKTYEGALKRARFETAHSHPKFVYGVVKVSDAECGDTYRITRHTLPRALWRIKP